MSEPQQILEKAISKAIDGGWEAPSKHFEVSMFAPDNRLVVFWGKSSLGAEEPNSNAERVIFNHDLAKSLFGSEIQNGQPKWRNALQYMVVQEDPVVALGRFLEL